MTAGGDPRGEDGAFHTFVTDGHVFEEPVGAELGDRTTRTDGHAGRTVHYRDVVPAD